MRKNLWLSAAIAVAAAVGMGCRGGEQAEPRIDEQQQGTGGSGYDHKAADSIGDKNGVIDDGEGPLEQDGRAEDKVGNEPGVFDDGEGPIEERQQNP